MMDFVVMTISFALGMLLASGLAVVLLTNSKVLTWYMKKVNKATMKAFEEAANIMED